MKKEEEEKEQEREEEERKLEEISTYNMQWLLGTIGLKFKTLRSEPVKMWGLREGANEEGRECDEWWIQNKQEIV